MIKWDWVGRPASRLLACVPPWLPAGWRAIATAAVGTLAARSNDGLQVVLRVEEKHDRVLYQVSLIGPSRMPTRDEIDQAVDAFFVNRSPEPERRQAVFIPHAMNLEQQLDLASVRLRAAQVLREIETNAPSP